MSQEFCVDRFPDQMTNVITYYRWSLNKLLIQYETREITLIDYADLHQELENKAQRRYEDEIRAAYEDGKESVIIKQCAEESTSNASSYSDGYNKGYMTALQYIKFVVHDRIKTITQ